MFTQARCCHAFTSDFVKADVSAQPEYYLFLLCKTTFVGSEHPEHNMFTFENNITGIYEVMYC